jgi:Ca2+/Na+ antiporter
MGITIIFILILLCCLIIWKASDGFEVASEYLGRNMSDGVRGATINAIASSIPELFATMFFLLILKDTESFSAGLGTTAGSAIFNGMIIPAVVILVVLFSGVAKSIVVSKKVILRDGISLIIAELILILIISGSTLYWWHGLILMLTYAAYITFMFSTMTKNDENSEENEGIEEEEEEEEEEEKSIFKAIWSLDLEFLVIGKSKIKSSNAWVLLISSMLVIGIACFMLVIFCEWLGNPTFEIPGLDFVFNGLDVPIMFVAVIIASAATSVPDTIISMKDAKKGNYNDAVSNAIGSNIFDICFALGFPLFMYTIFYGEITMSPEIVQFSSELRILLLILTVAAFFIYFIGKKMGVVKAYMLLALYLLFTIYIIGRSQEAEFANNISVYLIDIYNLIAR